MCKSQLIPGNRSFNREELAQLLANDRNEQDALFTLAASIKEASVGNIVYFRGLIEFSNLCSKDCLYCGIRKSNVLAQRYNLIDGVMPGGGPARYVRVAGTELRIGFITPISQHFCETCNRVRLSADGTLYMCLGQNERYPLREILRQGCSDDELQQHIIAAIELKPERHEFTEHPGKIIRFMSSTGG